MSEPLTGSPDDWWQVLGELEERNESMDRVAGEIDRNTEALAEVRQALSSRPTGRQIEYRRRMAAAFLAAYGVLIIWAHDQHVEHCGPGARVERGAEQSPVGAALCDVSFPFHGHDRGEQRPSSWALLGGGLYAAAGLAVARWVRHPTRDNAGHKEAS